ncbi:baeRF3 domain-containing protein [Corynebacterium guangdongense]|uniref:Nucleoid-associated protein n=1 Tax=Corynebacterium guangdongense TaxID=1783348 RepID=A0ABU1ZVJ9_9CORY|nr:hypothetical protein [Corynebacterium guangdongense]MDR7328958.1 hypothetical protein [Corynebacterium guangdongense]WJZ17531.1 hypothetical protein CGUA_04725 [Corynebacterium guangdongense]
MATKNIIKHSDPVRREDLRHLALQPGPTVSVTLPTHRGGAETRSDSQRLRPLLDDARRQLAERYPDTDADSLLESIESRVSSDRFWQTQCDGLALFAYGNDSRRYRLPCDFTPQVTVGDHPNLRPFLSLVTDDLEFIILAVSRDRVRLFAADRATITELPLGDIPESSEDVEGVSTREPSLQRSDLSGGYSTGQRDDVVVNGFLQAVGKAVEKRFSGDGRPVILASVEEYQSSIRHHLSAVTMLEDMVTGNPDKLSDAKLHEAAWPIAKAESGARHDKLVDKVAESLGTGFATTDPAAISENARVGRVKTLVLARRALDDQARSADLDAAIANTLINRGGIDVVEELPDGELVAALFRY